MSRLALAAVPETRLGPNRYALLAPGEGLLLVPPAIRNCAVFVGAEGPKGLTWGGTAFFVAVPFTRVQDMAFIYMVTAKHNVDGAFSDVRVRINTKAGACAVVSVSPDKWIYHPSNNDCDVAVIEWCPDERVFDYEAFPMTRAFTNEVASTHRIEPGDEVCLTGLFYNHTGSQRNIPIVRIGNLATIPEEPVRVALPDRTIDMEAYLVEMRSIGGHSGSPVFINPGQIRGQRLIVEPVFYLAGLMCGHWNEYAKPEAEPLNVGVGFVARVGQIQEVLDHPDLVDSRRNQEERHLREQAGRPD
jgi:hypothetical protein